MVADWRYARSTQLAAVDELWALHRAGLRVAVAQLESYRAATRRCGPLCGPVQQLLDAGAVERVLLTDDLRVGLVVVRQAEVLQFAGGTKSRIRAGRVVVVADRAPARGDGADRRYLPDTCTVTAERMFGSEPVWAAQDAVVRAALGTAAAGRVLDEGLPVVLAAPDRCPTRRGAGTPPVLGVDLCDAGQWPADLADAVAVYHGLQEVDVRLRLPDAAPLRAGLRPAGAAMSWLVYHSTDVEPQPFLRQLDFYLHFPHRHAAEAFSRPALAAAALGCVLLAPPRFTACYGDAAVYCAPEEVAEVLRGFRDPDRYTAQSRRAREGVARGHPPRAYVDRVVSLLEGVVTGAAPGQRRLTAAPDQRCLPQAPSIRP